MRAFIFTNKLFDITDKLTTKKIGIKLSDGDRMIGMYEGTYEGAMVEGNKVPHFIYYEKKDTRIHLLTASFPKPREKGEKMAKEDRQAMKQAANDLGITMKEYKQRLEAQDTQPEPIITRVDKLQLDPKVLLEKYFDKNRYKDELWWRDTKPEHFEITTAIITKKYFLVFSKYNCYRVEKNVNGIFNQNNTTVINNLRWTAFFVANCQHAYLLSDKDLSLNDNKVGFSYFDLNKFFDENMEVGEKYVDQRTWLEYAQVGANSCIDYGQKIERLAFIKDYSEICLIPNLHLNQVTLIGQQQIEKYIAVNQKQDAFYAISNNQDANYKFTLLTTWDILTGKRTCMKKFYQ